MRIQNTFNVIGKWGCLALSYLRAAFDISASEEEKCSEDYMNVLITSAIISAMTDRSLLDEECTVMNAKKLLESFDSGHTYNVTKKSISSINDLPEKGYACVKFSYNGNGHWVLFRDRVQIFDSLDDSMCRKYGRMTDARIIEYKSIGE